MGQGVKRTQRDYSLTFKLALVEQIEKGELTYKQAQVQRPAPGWQIGDVGDPDLLRCHRRDLLRPGLEQVGMTVETVKTVGGLVIRPPGLHQQAVLGQYLKQPVPPDLEPAIILTLQQIM